MYASLGVTGYGYVVWVGMSSWYVVMVLGCCTSSSLAASRGGRARRHPSIRGLQRQVEVHPRGGGGGLGAVPQRRGYLRLALAVGSEPLYFLETEGEGGGDGEWGGGVWLGMGRGGVVCVGKGVGRGGMVCVGKGVGG